MHPVPLFGYILEGELTVDYGAKGTHTYRKGDGFVEAIDEPHNGHNSGREPVKILAIIIGAAGVEGAFRQCLRRAEDEKFEPVIPCTTTLRHAAAAGWRSENRRDVLATRPSRCHRMRQ